MTFLDYIFCFFAGAILANVVPHFVYGISGDRGAESTARNAHDHGYNVVLVVDAMTDRDADAHRNSVEKIFPRIGETTTTDEVLSHLQEAPRPINVAARQ